MKKSPLEHARARAPTGEVNALGVLSIQTTAQKEILAPPLPLAAYGYREAKCDLLHRVGARAEAWRDEEPRSLTLFARPIRSLFIAERIVR